MYSRLSGLWKLSIFWETFPHVCISIELSKYSLWHAELVFEMYAMLGKQYSTLQNEAFAVNSFLCCEVVKHGVMLLSMQYLYLPEIVLNSRFVWQRHIYMNITLCMFMFFFTSQIILGTEANLDNGLCRATARQRCSSAGALLFVRILTIDVQRWRNSIF